MKGGIESQPRRGITLTREVQQPQKGVHGSGSNLSDLYPVFGMTRGGIQDLMNRFAEAGFDVILEQMSRRNSRIINYDSDKR